MRVAPILLIVLALVLPGAASAQSAPNPLQPGPTPLQPQPAPPPTEPVQPAPRPVSVEEEEDGGLDVATSLLALAAVIALIGGIAWFIVRDAHRVAPVVEDLGRPEEEATGRPGTRGRQERARKRAKAARRQRKRNRAR